MADDTALWSVEPAAESEASVVLRVQHEAFADPQRRFDAPLPQMEETEQDVAAAIRAGEALVARQGGEVIGAVRVRTQGVQAEVSHLSVLPAYGRLAVGRSLMAAAEDRARDGGARTMVLETELRNAAAIEFYLGQGYRPDALLPDPVTEIDLVRFRRGL